MKKWILGIIGIICLMPCLVQAKEVNLYLFYGDGCPHCADEKTYLKKLKAEHPDLNIVLYEVWKNDANADFMNQVKEKLNMKNPYVPFTVIGTQGFTGFSESIEEGIKAEISKCEQETCTDVVDAVLNQIEVEVSPSYFNSIQTLPILGKVDVKKVSIPLLASVLGFVDGFNPCAMWILVFLITLLMGTHDYRKMTVLGSIFLFVSGGIYFFFLATWLKITISFSSIIWLRNLIAVFAIIVGCFQLQKYNTSKTIGCHVTGNQKRKNLMNRMRDIVSKKSIWLSIIGIIFLAVSVNLIELACSAGIPLLFTQILSINDIKGISSILYLLLYVLFYMLDDLIIFILAITTLKVKGISNRFVRYSYLIGGSILLILGTLLLVKPEWVMLSF